MQELSPYASKRRVGCVMWLAILAIVMSGISLLSSVTQELAWDRRIQEFSALAISVDAQNVSPTAIALEQSPTRSAVIIEPSSSSPTSTPLPPPSPSSPQASTSAGLTYAQICGVDESNMTDPQLEAHAARFNGQTFTGWQGWVYDVVSKSDGTYDLEIAMEERGLFWGREIIVESIPTDLALRLNVEQALLFDGRIATVEYSFEVMCNPMKVDDFALKN